MSEREIRRSVLLHGLHTSCHGYLYDNGKGDVD